MMILKNWQLGKVWKFHLLIHIWNIYFFYCSGFWIYFAFWLYCCWRPNSNIYHFNGVYIFIGASPLKIWFRPRIRFKPHAGNKDWFVCSLMLWFYVLISRKLQVLAVPQFSNKMRSIGCILCFSLTIFGYVLNEKDCWWMLFCCFELLSVLIDPWQQFNYMKNECRWMWKEINLFNLCSIVHWNDWVYYNSSLPLRKVKMEL